MQPHAAVGPNIDPSRQRGAQREITGLHTWPEANYAALDVFMCGIAEPQNAIPVLQEAFGTTNVRVEELRRGRGMV